MESQRQFIVTPALVAMNVASFLALVLLGVSPIAPEADDLLRFGANFGGYIAEGEWWRLLTSAFLHYGLAHLGLNMFALWSLGRLAEPMFGSGGFLVVYVLAALGGSAASVLWHPWVFSAGASGAVFGIAGALAAFLYTGHVHLPRAVAQNLLTTLVIVIAFNLAIGAAIPGIDNAGHLGGLAVGTVLGAVLRHRSVFYLGATAVIAALFAIAPIAKQGALDDPRVLVNSTNDNDELLGKLEAAMERDPENTETLTIAAEVYLREERYEEAAAAARRAIELDPELDVAQILLGTALFYGERYDEAVEELRLAVEMKRDELGTYFLLSRALQEIDEGDEAVAVLEEALTWDPESAGIHSEIGLAHHRNGDPGLAAAALRKAVALEPEQAEHHNRLSLVLAVAGEGDASLEAVQTALELSPDAPHILDSLGTVRFYRREYDEAVDAYRKALAKESEQAVYLYNLSLALREIGEDGFADEAKAKAFELDPDLEPPDHGGPII